VSPLQIIIRLVAATLLGSALGFDRELRGKPAGMRTHALVALGAALVTISAIELVGPSPLDRGAVTRAIQGIITGIGFLGGGAILRARDSDDVRGLTTAASIWLVSALGIACGGGFWLAALVSAVLALLVLVLGTKLERWFHARFHVPKYQKYQHPAAPPPVLPED
jgi:putative Mg2+ transporter-C (MgtC) family protein